MGENSDLAQYGTDVALEHLNICFDSCIFAHLVAAAYARECYNRKEEPKIRNCDHGCCGNDYEEHCCDATLQIVGCILGGVVLIGVVIGIVYYCYRQKTKHRRQTQQTGGLLARFGMMRSNNNVHQQSHIPQMPGRGAQRIHAVGGGNFNAHYNPQYIQSVQLAGPPPSCYLYPGNAMYERPPIAPTAPMPPPYSMAAPAAPPYTVNKLIPPPPEYHTIVSHGYKDGNNIDGMPPPSS